MPISRIWIRLSWMMSALVAIASAAGLFVPAIYARESTSWAAQGMGQDIVNLVVAVPVLLVSTWYVHRGSLCALMVWIGALIYVVYSYVIYAFFIQFGPAFPLYVAVLGLSTFALIGASAGIDRARVQRCFPPGFRLRAVGAVLVFLGLAFGTLWLMSIARGLATGGAPIGVAETGLPVNPIHVLDLAFVLPLLIVTGVSHWKGHAFGLVFATPLLVFTIIMDFAIIAMTYAMRSRGLTVSLGIVPMMGAGIVVGIVLSTRLLRAVAPADRAVPMANRPAPARDIVHA